MVLDENDWELKDFNLRGRIFNLEQMQFWNLFPRSVLEEFFLTIKQEYPSPALSVSDLPDAYERSNNSNSVIELSKSQLSYINNGIFTIDPTLWINLAFDNSEFAEYVFCLKSFFFGFLNKVKDERIINMQPILIRNDALRSLWELKDRSTAVHKNMKSFQSYFERLTEINDTLMSESDFKSIALAFLTTLQSICFTSLKPLISELQKVGELNSDLIINAITRQKMRSNYYTIVKFIPRYNYRTIRKHPRIVIQPNCNANLMKSVADLAREYGTFFWAIEASIDDLFMEMDNWSQLISKDPDMQEAFLQKIFDEWILQILPRKFLNIWEELNRCFKVKAFSACAILLRKLLESLIWDKWRETNSSDDLLRTADKNPKSLTKIIEICQGEHLISRSLANEAQSIRFYGGVQAHDFKVFRADESDVIRGISCIKSIIQHFHFEKTYGTRI